jgi:hypothetical protein
MARSQVTLTSGQTQPGSNSLGSSSSGHMVVEIDLTKFANINALRQAMNLVLKEFAGQLPP